MTILGAHPGAGLTTDAVHRIDQAHHHTGIVGKSVIVFIIEIGFIVQFAFDKIKNITGTDLVASSATDTRRFIQRDYECRCPHYSPTGNAGDHITAIHRTH